MCKKNEQTIKNLTTELSIMKIKLERERNRQLSTAQRVPSLTAVGGALEDIQAQKQLAPQMASSVEWTSQIETMYGAGARAFVEVGPKRALTMFATQILADKPHLPIMTNHPKQGGVRSFLSSLGQLAILGQKVMNPSLENEIYSDSFRAGPIESSRKTKEVEISVPHVIESPKTIIKKVNPGLSIDEWVANLCSEFSGYPSSVCKGNVSLTDDLGISPNSLEKLKIQRIVIIEKI